MQKKLYSFDIFDTLITRTTATPEGIFALMQQELSEGEEFADIPARVRKNFLLIRRQCESVARLTFLNDTVQDLTLELIYCCIKNTMGLTQEQTERLEELELRTEYENSIPIVYNIERIKKLLDEGKRVVLISNMYLRQKNIRKMLLQADAVFADVTMYVSGELGKIKNTWALYQYVKEQEGVEYSNWLHVGDHEMLDVEIPLKMGMHAEQYPKASLLPWEQALLDQRLENVDLQLLVGASLRARQNRTVGYPYTVGVGYTGPLLYPYVEWLLKESVQKGFQRLFFIARDGYVLKEIADIIIRRQGLEIETYYLYGSRKAWRLPSITIEKFDMKEFLKCSYTDQIYSYEQIAGLFEMSVSELKQFLPFDPEKEVTLSSDVVREVLRILTYNQRAVASFVAEHQSEKRMAVVEYLKQTLDVEKGNFAFVDLIGSGYTQKCLAELMTGWYSERVFTFFYRLDSCGFQEKNINIAYYTNHLCMGSIIEVLCSANHGQTVGYVKKGDIWEPVLDKDEGQDLDAYGFQEYLSGICEYTKELVLYRTGNETLFQDLSIPTQYFSYLENVGDQDLFQYIADMPYGILGVKNETKCFAPRLSDRTLRQLYLFHRDEPLRKYYSGYALDFSLLRLTEKQKKRVVFYQRISNEGCFKWIRKRIANRKKGQMRECKYELIADQIVLYGAGKRGRLLHQQLTHGKRYHTQIVLWVDKKYENCRKDGLDVCSPEQILKCKEYKQIVIAVMNQEMAEEITGELIEMGVPGHKLLWVCPSRDVV